MSYDERRVAADLERRQGSVQTAVDWPHVSTHPMPPAAADDGQQLEEPSPASSPTGARKGPRVAREIVETLLLALVIFVGVRLVVLNFRVDGSSMVPNLHNQEMLLVNRNVYFHFDLNELRNLLPGEDRDSEDIVYPFHPPERGDIVVFNPPTPVNNDKPYIKRVIGLPGETITFRDGGVFVDGQRLVEPYLDDDSTDCGRCQAETVDEGEVYVLGDNRDNSQDSRMFGAVDVDSIIGKAWLTYWPMDELGLVPHYDYPEISDAP